MKKNEAATRIQASFRGSMTRHKQHIDSEVRETVQRIEEEKFENQQILDEHQILLQQVAEAIEEMGENIDFGVDVEPIWETSFESHLDVYHRKLEEFIDAEDTCLAAETDTSSKLTRLNAKYEHELEIAIDIRDKFKEFRRTILKSAVNSRTGKPIHKKWILQMEQEEADLDDQLERTRLNNIRLQTRLKRLELAIKEKEKLGDGLALIDFEQLKIENQTLGEKIEERNGELLKLNNKIDTTVHIKAHVQEKLQFVTKKNTEGQAILNELETQISNERDELTKYKKKRDDLRSMCQKLKVKQGFSGSDALVNDYERRKDFLPNLEKDLENLREKHSTLVQLRQHLNMESRAIESSHYSSQHPSSHGNLCTPNEQNFINFDY